MPSLAPTPPRWKHLSKCFALNRYFTQQQVAYLFFPAKNDNATRKAMLDYCQTCPVIHPCLEEAVRLRQRGIWGGTTDKDRRDLLNVVKATGMMEDDVDEDADEGVPVAVGM